MRQWSLIVFLLLSALSLPPVSSTLTEIREFIGGIFRRDQQQPSITTESSENTSTAFSTEEEKFLRHDWRGKTYILSWREGEDSFTWDEAKNYCQVLGMIMLSLDDFVKRDHFMQLIEEDGVPAFWVGGELSKDKKFLSWENGKIEGIRKGLHPWSFAGLRGPQPDGLDSENCLAVLNNFYNDGVKFHDIGCFHKKPTICQTIETNSRAEREIVFLTTSSLVLPSLTTRRPFGNFQKLVQISSSGAKNSTPPKQLQTLTNIGTSFSEISKLSEKNALLDSVNERHIWEGVTYLLSWREGRDELTWNEAKRYCLNKGMVMVSLDSAVKREYFMKLVEQNALLTLWLGGELSLDKSLLSWENGRIEKVEKGIHPWSFTGLRGPQPDGLGAENCLAILNNFYNDGVKFHDVGCFQKKSTICQPLQESVVDSVPSRQKDLISLTSETSSFSIPASLRTSTSTEISTETKASVTKSSENDKKQEGKNISTDIHVWEGGEYLLTWREGNDNLTWDEAKGYCKTKEMTMISLDNEAKKEHFLQLVEEDGVPALWTGGEISRDKRLMRWENGIIERITKGQHPWSFTGLRGAQPDGEDSEHCVAILNNFYDDGVKFHDIGYFEKKPTICEQIKTPSTSTANFSSTTKSSLPTTFLIENPSTITPESNEINENITTTSSSSKIETLRLTSIKPNIPNSVFHGKHVWAGKTYLLSWQEGRNNFTWVEARNYCIKKGMKMVSLDTAPKTEHFMQLVQEEGLSAFWAGGEISTDKRLLRWENGKLERITKGQHPWSFTGTRGAQPDGEDSEHCVAVLNNAYDDGVKFHDASCEHSWPTICQG